MLRIGSFFFPPLKSIAIYLIVKKEMNLRKSRKVPVCPDCLLLCRLHDLFHGIALDVKPLCGIAHSLIDSVIYLAEFLDILISEIQIPDGATAGGHIMETVGMAQPTPGFPWKKR